MTDRVYRVKLENVFEGPMDLLVHLIKKHEVDIYDIPIALITERYLAYLEWLKLMNIDFAGDFLVMASTLAQIKSRTLLPAHGDEDDEDDPRLEIVRPLEEYLQMKSVADQLASRDLLGEAIFTRQPDQKKLVADPDQQLINVGLFELIDAFQKILERVSKDHKVDMSDDTISVKDRMNEIIALLEEKGSVTFDELFGQTPTKSLIVVSFLSLLELMKMNLVRVVQNLQSGIMRLFYQ